MKIKTNSIYINVLLEPLKSEYDTKFTMYPYKMMPIYKESKPYHVDINGTNGLKSRGARTNKLDIFAQVDLFDNSNCSNNITDLFSFLDYEPSDNVTTYTHYSRIKNLPYCPDQLGLLDLQESYKPLALQNISTKLYVSIYEKYTNLLNILSH